MARVKLTNKQRAKYKVSKAKNKIKKKKLKEIKKIAYSEKKLAKKVKADLRKSQKRAKYQLNMDELKEMLPSNFGGSVNTVTLSNINDTLARSKIGEDMKDKVMGFSSVLAEGRFKVSAYIDAVHYVSYKAMSFTNEKAYSKVFKKKYQRMVNEGKSKKYISGFVSSYNRGKLVQLLVAQTITPNSIFYSDQFHKAVLCQTRLLNSTNQTVAQKAADSLMGHLKQPDAVDVKLSVGDEGIDIVKQMMTNSAELAKLQRQAINNGSKSAVDIIEGRIIPKEKFDVPVAFYKEKEDEGKKGNKGKNKKRNK